jgi:hypothetical protein
MDKPIPLPIVSVREVLSALGFTPVWGTATDLDPVYEFKGGGIDIGVAQVTSLSFRPEFLIGGFAADARTLKYVKQSMPLALESRDQVVAWLSFAIGPDFRPSAPVPWFDEGRQLQHLLPWERRRLELRAEMEEYARLRLIRPHCVVDRHGLRAVLNSASRAPGWPPAPGDYTISFDGEVLKLRARGQLAVVRAHGAAWPNTYSGGLRDLHCLPRRLDLDLVEVGIWQDMLEIGRVCLPVVASGPTPV